MNTTINISDTVDMSRWRGSVTVLVDAVVVVVGGGGGGVLVPPRGVKIEVMAASWA